MANDKSESQPENPGKNESLSATDMFLRSFGEGGKPEPGSADPLRTSSAPPARAAQQPPSTPQAAGEFTQLFQSLQSKPAAPAPLAPAEAQSRPGTAPIRTQHQNTGEHAGDRGPGEFTRIFVGGSHPPAPRNSEDPTRPLPLPTQSPTRAKGFSTPGMSASASGEGSFTQLFNSPAHGASPSPSPTAPAAPPSSGRNSSWDNDPLFRPQQNTPPPEPASSSVTSLLASLGKPSRAPSPGRQQEAGPYQPEPPVRSTPIISHEPVDASGGVTRFIERLAQMPVEPAPPPPIAPLAPSASAGPSEFTRIISRAEAGVPAAEPPASAPPPAPAPVSFAFPAAPALPAVPHMPAAQPIHVPVPAGAAQAASAPRFAPPAMPAVAIPAVPKPPAPAVPALAPPKSKLEAMVPILLVINTFLLLILLVVVIFLIKSR